ncbi:MAG: tRNA (N6-isopentenyl adenosine(37)-C2)-methylthiotransferase MiaB [Firmicutes bacterium]|nr:tRNA (N6-isopentenyl adenosine(37)-C2)-methylthiotransferase MiaB [Bacillota bacterium]
MSETNYNKPLLKNARKRSFNETIVSEYQIPLEIKNFGKNKKYLIQTHGCQANEADSEKLRGLLETEGFFKTDDLNEADLIIINTCAIRKNAENKVFGEIGRLKKYKVLNPNLVLAVGGCMPQEEEVVEKLLKTYPQVDIIFGTHNLHKFLEYLYRVMIQKERMIEVLSFEGEIVEHVPTVRENRYKAWVNIMYGCDEFCTYCIVPYTRGKERSRKPIHIIEEINELITQGYKEVTLLGQNVNSYGLDFVNEKYTFADLLKELSSLPIERIRFTTSHPKDFSFDLIDMLAKGKNLMPYIHLPVQSGSNKILKAMNRKYTKESYLNLINKIYEKIPDVSITTDIIVGFPGETEEDFLETLDLVRQASFEGAYTFVFSPRTGTPAASFIDTTPDLEKKARLYKLNEIVNQGYAKGNSRFLNQNVSVLVEGHSKTNPSILTGYSNHNKLVNFKGDDSLIGTIVQVKIIKAKTWSLTGELFHE